MAIIGIDLGTTNSLACVWKTNRCILIPNAFHSFLTPSVVSFMDNGEVLIGEAAKQRLVTHPSTTFEQFKRFMGSDMTFQVGDKQYQSQDLSAFVIRKLIDDARVYLREDIEEAIISVPAYFNDDQRWATKIAGQLAGIKVERIINEPSAAALAQHMEQRDRDTLNLVVDFGGGTLDISIVEAFDNVVEIRAISGDNHLGGADFDQALLDAFLREHALDASTLHKQELALLKMEIEKAKKQLSLQEEVCIQVIISGIAYAMSLNRGKMSTICLSLLQRIRTPLERVLKDAQVTLADIDEVVLVGGSCRMPIVIQFLEYLLKRDVVVVNEPDQAIALGCGVVSGIKARNGDIRDMMLSDICPFTLGIEISEDNTPYTTMSAIIERNSTLPCSVEKLFSYRSRNGQLELHILQGEHRKAHRNLLLKTVEITLPKTEKDVYEPIVIRFTYDINGLLEVETNTLLKRNNQRIIIQNKMNRMSEKEMQAKLKELEAYKLPNHQKEVYQHLLERGERLYYESTTDRRSVVASLLEEFETVLHNTNTHAIHDVYKKVKRAFDEMEESEAEFLS